MMRSAHTFSPARRRKAGKPSSFLPSATRVAQKLALSLSHSNKYTQKRTPGSRNPFCRARVQQGPETKTDRAASVRFALAVPAKSLPAEFFVPLKNSARAATQSIFLQVLPPICSARCSLSYINSASCMHVCADAALTVYVRMKK